MRTRWGKAVRLALLTGWFWLGWHIFLIDPWRNPGA
jgi:hypothetical protein